MTKIIISFIAIIIIAIFYILPAKHEMELFTLYKVKRGDLKISLKKNGTLSPVEKLEVTPGIRENLKFVYIIPEKTKVHKGQILAEFDPQEILKRLKDIKEEIQSLQMKLKILEIELAIEQEMSKFEKLKAYLDYSSFINESRKYKKFDCVFEKRKRKIAVEDAKVKLNKIRKKLKKLPSLTREGLATKDELIQNQILEKNIWRSFVKAKGEFRIYKKYTAPIELIRKENELKDAKVQLKSISKRLRIKLKHKKEQIFHKKMILKEFISKLEDLQKKRKGLVLKSPISGIAIHGNLKSSRKNYKIGDEIWGKTVIMTIPNLQKMKAKLMISEKDIYSLKIGMPCFIKISSKKELIKGKISRIAELATTNDSWLSHGKEFEVEIIIEEENSFRQPKISAKIEIQIALLKNVIFIPKHAVKKKMGKSFCYVYKNKKLDEVRIELGKIGETFVEVKSGLNEGDKIFLGLN